MLNNRQKTTLLYIVASPFFLAIPLTLVIIFFLPNPSSKYKIEQVSKQVANKKRSKIVYCDLNNDGADERVIGFHNAVKGEAAIKVLTNDGINYDAWNFHGYFQYASENFYCTDINNDGFSEIFVFYYLDDSVFLAVIQPYPDKKIIFDRKFITTVWVRDDNIDFLISDFIRTDLNNDGNSDLIFLLKAGFSRQPRVIIAYDFFNDTIIKSISVAANLSLMQILDDDGNEFPEIYCGSTTAGNIPDSMGIPYSDYYSWFFGFNNKLELMFPPIKNTYYPSGLSICTYKSDEGENFIAAAFNDNVKKLQTVKFFNSGNKVTSEKEFKSSVSSKSSIVSFMKNITIEGRKFIIMGIYDNVFILINEKLEIIRRKALKSALSLRLINDLNKDGKNEFVFMSPEFELIIYDHNLENPAIFNTNILPFAASWFSVGIKHNGDKQDEIFLKTDNYLTYYTYNSDYFYYLKYPLWLLVYGFITFLLWVSQRLQKIQSKRKQVIEETINSLQMKTIKSQMDPHFMFNVLNGLANNVAMGNTKEAHDQIIRFSILLRSMMKRTDKIDIRLADEIEFVSSYLELEKFRFKDDFEFEINLEESVDQNIRLPRMLVQLLVENAIKHGLRNKEGIKKLNVNILSKDKSTLIIVEDNGVGRKEAMKKPSDTGKGMKLIVDMIRLNRKLGGKEITVNYTDLYDEGGKAAGTRVEVVV